MVVFGAAGHRLRQVSGHGKHAPGPAVLEGLAASQATFTCYQVIHAVHPVDDDRLTPAPRGRRGQTAFEFHLRTLHDRA